VLASIPSRTVLSLALLCIALALGCEEGAAPGQPRRGANRDAAVTPDAGTVPGLVPDAGAPLRDAAAPPADTGSADLDSGVELLADAALNAQAAEPCTPDPLAVSALPNARDLGGLPLAGGATVACAGLYRGANLADLGPDGCSQFQALGVETVIDLREGSEISAHPEDACTTLDSTRVLAPMPIPYTLDGPAYLTALHTTAAITAAFDALGNPDAYPIFIHCTYGRDRTAVLTAVILSVLGASREEIMTDYMLTPAPVFPDALVAVLDALDAAGGVDAFLASAGVAPQQIATLRAHNIAGP
jgi:hypothetical protein